MREKKTSDLDYLSYIVEGIISSKNLDVDETTNSDGYNRWKISSGPILGCEIEMMKERKDLVLCNVYPVFSDLGTGEDVYLPPSTMVGDASKIQSWVEASILENLNHADKIVEILSKVSDSVFDGGFVGIVSDGEVSSYEDGVVFPVMLDFSISGKPFTADLTIRVDQTSFLVNLVVIQGSMEIFNKQVCRSSNVPTILNRITFSIKDMMGLCSLFEPPRPLSVYEQILKEPGKFGNNVIPFIFSRKMAV